MLWFGAFGPSNYIFSIRSLSDWFTNTHPEVHISTFWQTKLNGNCRLTGRTHAASATKSSVMNESNAIFAVDSNINSCFISLKVSCSVLIISFSVGISGITLPFSCKVRPVEPRFNRSAHQWNNNVEMSALVITAVRVGKYKLWQLL